MENSALTVSLALQQRKILLYDDVNENSILEAIYLLHRLRDLDEKYSDTKRPIEIQINSNGGNVDDGLTLISLIESMKEEGYEIITTNIGRAYSMGFLISLCGSKRTAYRYAHYMYHDISYGLFGKHGDIVEYIETCKHFREIIKEIVCKYTTLKKEELDDINIKKQDKYFNVDEMLELKGVDEIV